MSECWVLEKKVKGKVTKASAVVVVPDRVQAKKSVLPQPSYHPFVSQGFVSLYESDPHQDAINILRDTGASQSLLITGVLPLLAKTATRDHVLIQAVELGYASVPIHKAFLQSVRVSDYVAVSFDRLPVDGVSLLLGNDKAGEKVIVDPLLSSLPCLPDSSDQVMQDIPGLYRACAVTRSIARKGEKLPPVDSDNQAVNELSEKCRALKPTPESVVNYDDILDLSTTFLGMTDNPSADSVERKVVQNDESLPSISTQELIKQQESHPDFISLWQEVLDDDEAAKGLTCFYRKSGVLIRKWRPPTAPCQDEWQVSHQIVVPSCYSSDILHLHTLFTFSRPSWKKQNIPEDPATFLLAWLTQRYGKSL